TLHLDVVVQREARVEGVALERATAADARAVDEGALGVQVDQLGDLVLVQILGRLLGVGRESIVVLLDEGVEEGREQRVRLGVRRVDSDARVEVGDS
ncbi:hypothetical protein PENTCL1PPCAC_3522, partial [Pristionchus entomophagus]